MILTVKILISFNLMIISEIIIYTGEFLITCCKEIGCFRKPD